MSLNEQEELRLEAIRSVKDTPAERAVREALDAYDGALDDAEEGSPDLEEDNERLRDAINAFCDEVARPIGAMTYEVPRSEAVDRAIRGLHDAIGRNI